MAIGGLIVLALTVALVGPYFVDWSNYRADFEREASRILGRDVEVRGTATARLLPFPSVTFTDVLVSGAGGETVMTVETFSMDAELAPFLSGEILIFDMRLERPDVLITVGENGTLDWAARPNVPIDTRHIALENVAITDGRITLRHLEGDRQHMLTDINAEVSARTLAGPWRATGNMLIDGMETAVTVTTGTANPGGSLRVRLRAQPQAYPLTLETEGDAVIEETGAIAYQGQFRLSAYASRQAASEGGERPGPPDYRLTGSFRADHERISSDEFRFEAGSLDDPYTAEGSAMVSIGENPRFHIAAEGVQLRMEEAEGGAASLDERIGALRGFVAGLPKPAMPGSIELDLPAVIAGDTTIREVRIRAEPSEAGWRLASVNATLPGRAMLEASGDLTVGDELEFAGSLLLAVNQPSGFAAWLSRDVDEVIRRLPVAGFSAQVQVGERQQSFRDLELVLGASTFRGDIDNRQPEGARPAMSLRLEGDGLDVEGMTAFASLFVSGRGENRLEDHDLDFEIVANDVSLAGMTAGSVDTALRLREGQLEIDRLRIVGLAGANVSATGSIQDISGAPTGSLDAAIIAVDLEPLVSMLAERLPENRLLSELARRARDYPGIMEDAEFAFVASAAPARSGDIGLSVSANGKAGNSTMVLTASSRDWTGDILASPISANVNLESEEASELYGWLGLPAVPLGFAGPGEAEVVLSGIVRDGADLRLDLSGEGMHAKYAGEVRLDRERFSAKGRGDLRGEDLVPWLMTAAVSLPGMDAGIPVNIGAELDYSDGLLVLSGLEGEVAGAHLRGDLNTETRDGVPHLTGELFLDAFELSLAAEMLLGPDALQQDGSAWPSAAFRSSVSAPFTADLKLLVDDLLLGDALKLTGAEMTARIGRDGISVSDLSAGAFGGRLTGLGEMRNDGGEGLLSAQLQLEDADAGQVLPHTGISGKADLSASLSSTGKSIDAMFASLAGSGTAAANDLVIQGLAANAFDNLLAAADRVGREVGTAATASFAPEIVRAGRFAAGDVEFAFTIAGGTLRAAPIQISDAGARLSVEPGVNFAAMRVSADATIQYDAGVESLVGSEPAIRFIAQGPLHDISVRSDTEPLARFLTQRALEREQRRVEDMQAALLEQQRIRREVRYYASLRQERLYQAAEQRLAEEEAQRLVEEEVRRRVEAEERRLVEEERREAEEAARRIAEEEERRRALEEAEIRAEQERRRMEEERRRAAEEARVAEEARRLEEERIEEEARIEEERRRRLQDEIESILRLEESRLDDPDAMVRAPLEAPEAQSTAGAGQEAGGLSRSSPPAVGRIFRPENLSPEGLSSLSEAN